MLLLRQQAWLSICFPTLRFTDSEKEMLQIQENTCLEENKKVHVTESTCQHFWPDSGVGLNLSCLGLPPPLPLLSCPSHTCLWAMSDNFCLGLLCISFIGRAERIKNTLLDLIEGALPRPFLGLHARMQHDLKINFCFDLRWNYNLIIGSKRLVQLPNMVLFAVTRKSVVVLRYKAYIACRSS